jgi:hypothetical protein
MSFDDLTSENFLLYAVKAYDKPNCIMSEFKEDMKRFNYLKRLFYRYRKDGEVKEYQGIYNKSFVPAYALKNFKLVDYSSSKVVEGLASKRSKDLKPHERFVLNVTGEYGCKDYYTFKEITDYNPDDNLVSSDAAISEEDADY